MAEVAEARAEEILAGLVAWLDQTVPGVSHEPVSYEHPAAGYSSETILVDIRRSDADASSEQRLVAKLAPSSSAVFPVYDFAMQARVQQAVAAAGIPTAVPATFENQTRWVGAPFMVMPAIPGQIFGEVPALDERLMAADPASNAALHGTYIDLVADINNVDWHAAGLAEVMPRRDNAAELAYWRDYLAWYADGEDLVPALSEALDWCEDHQPKHEPVPSLLWGDVRMENLIYDDDLEPAAVLDWEMATIGTAEHDLAWALTLETTMTELVGLTVPGFLDHDEALDRYEIRLGRSVQDLGWYEILAALRSTAIMSRISHLNDRNGVANFYPIADNPLLDILARRIDAA